MSDKVNIGIIGFGSRIKDLLKHIPFLNDKIFVSAIADKNRAVLDDSGKLISNSCKFYDDYRKLIKNDNISWVFVSSPNSAHAEHTVASLEAGKNVFCEKPIATNYEDCIKIRQAVKKNKKEFIVGFTLRFSPHYRKIKEIVDSGFIGNVISMEFNETIPFYHGGHIHSGWRRDSNISGGHMLEKCSHDLDIMNWIAASSPEKVASFGGKNFFKPENIFHQERIGVDENGKKAYQQLWGELDRRVSPFSGESNVVDNQTAVIEYKNGIHAVFHTNCNAAIPERRAYICGTEGGIRADAVAGKIEKAKIDYQEEIIDDSTHVSGSHAGGDDILGPEIAESILKGTKSATSVENGFLAGITAFAVDKSMNESKIVYLNE